MTTEIYTRDGEDAVVTEDRDRLIHVKFHGRSIFCVYDKRDFLMEGWRRTSLEEALWRRERRRQAEYLGRMQAGVYRNAQT